MCDEPRKAAAAAARVEALMAPLMPAQASWAVGACAGVLNTSGAAELALVSRAVSRRQREFIAGRSLARRALVRFGLGQFEILSGNHREPLWPAGIVGSITHAGGVAAAAVASSAEVLGIGIDLEVITAEELPHDTVIGVAERTGFESLSGTQGASAFFAYFSAKEAVFKAMYPRFGRYFDFLDVVLEPGTGRTFRCRPLPSAPRDRLWDRLRVRWDTDGGYVFSTALLAAQAGG